MKIVRAVSLLWQLSPCPAWSQRFSAIALSKSELERWLLTLVVPQDPAEIPLPTLPHVVERAGVEGEKAGEGSAVL